MKITTFKYTKADGSTSQRTLLVSTEPTKLVAGTDITSLSMEDQGRYAVSVAALKDKYLDAVKCLNDQFDLNHNFRQFKPECMSDIVSEIL